MAVEPLLLPTWHLLASVEEEYNAVYLRCASSGDLSLFGKGAGALPTATAVLGDLIDLAQDNSVRWPVPQPLPLARQGRQRRARPAPPLPARRPASRIPASSAASKAWCVVPGSRSRIAPAAATTTACISGS